MLVSAITVASVLVAFLPFSVCTTVMISSFFSSFVSIFSIFHLLSWSTVASPIGLSPLNTCIFASFTPVPVISVDNSFISSTVGAADATWSGFGSTFITILVSSVVPSL